MSIRRYVEIGAVLTLLSGYGADALLADKVVLVAGGEKAEVGVPAIEARLDGPFAADFNSAGEIFIAEIAGHRVLKVDRQGNLHLIAGTGAKGSGGDGGAGAKAQFNGMHSLVVGADDAIYVADTWNNRIRRIEPKSGIISAFAGTGTKGFGGDGGSALKAQFGGVYCIALDPQRENLYLADLDNRRIRRINLADGRVTTVAGNGKTGTPADGAVATEAPLVDPRAVAVDGDGNIYILERGGHALRVVDAEGKIRTVAGTGKSGNFGDGGPALQARFNGPKHLCIDAAGDVLIADTENHVVRKYLPKAGQVVRVAGTGKQGRGGVGGPALEVQLAKPHGVHIDQSGILYVADSENNRILKIVP